MQTFDTSVPDSRGKVTRELVDLGRGNRHALHLVAIIVSILTASRAVAFRLARDENRNVTIIVIGRRSGEYLPIGRSKFT